MVTPLELCQWACSADGHVIGVEGRVNDQLAVIDQVGVVDRCKCTGHIELRQACRSQQSPHIFLHTLLTVLSTWLATPLSPVPCQSGALKQKKPCTGHDFKKKIVLFCYFYPFNLQLLNQTEWSTISPSPSLERETERQRERQTDRERDIFSMVILKGLNQNVGVVRFCFAYIYVCVC